MAEYELGRNNRLLDEWNLRLSGDIMKGATRPAFLFFDFRYTWKRNSGEEVFRDPHIGVNLGIQGKENKIDWYPTPANLFGVFKIFERLIERGENKTRVLEELTDFKFGKKLDKFEVENKIAVGLDDEGAFIMIIQQGRERAKFYLRPAEGRAVLRDEKGELLTRRESSMDWALGLIDAWMFQYKNILANHYMTDAEYKLAKEKKRSDALKRFSGGNNNGNNRPGNNNQYGQSGQSQPPQQQSGGNFDEDIPWN